MKTPISVTFDRNVYEFVVNPEKERLPINEKRTYEAIHKMIESGTILPFISESVFTLETLKRKNSSRKNVLGHRERIITTNSESNGNTSVITVGSNPYIHPGNHEKDNEFLAKAIELGFKILPIYRLGRLVNPAIKAEWRYILPTDDILEIPTKFAEIFEVIESNGGGFAWLKVLLNVPDDNSKPWFDYIQYYTGTDKKFDAAVAEWSDGDSIAAHIASKIDYFCTNDMAKTAGNKSAFNVKMKALLHEQFNLNVVAPFDLLNCF